MKKNSKTEKILDMLENHSAIVPAIWSLEVANMLLVAIRKKRITPILANNFMTSIKDLSIQIDDSTAVRAMNNTFNLALQEGFTIYDAAYLDIAIRENIPIATQDSDIKSLNFELRQCPLS